MAASRGANLQVEQLYARTGWSRKELARRVNQHPQPPVPELLSELFSEQFSYPITPVDIGLPATDEHEVGLLYSESIAATVIAVAELGRYDLRRRGFLRHGTFLAVAAIAPSRDWLLAVLDANDRAREVLTQANLN